MEASNFITLVCLAKDSLGEGENGEYDGMVDLIVMRKKGSKVTAEEIFSPDQDPPIPYHCIKN